MNPMILSDKVAGIIKDLEVQVGIKDIALSSAIRRIEDLKDQINELTNSNEELQEVIRDIGSR
jgi:predicted site-specific integrase-resolvase